MIIIERTMTAAPLRDVEALAVLLFEGEQNAHQFKINPPERITFSGYAVTARMIRSNQTDVAVTGWLDAHGRANIVLTPGCYAVPGNYRLFIYVKNPTEGDEKTVCIYACTGTVVPTVGKNGPAPATPEIIETYPEGALDALAERVTAVESGSAFMPALVQYSEKEMKASYDYPAGEIISIGMELYRFVTDVARGDTLSTSNPRNIEKISLRRYLSGTGRALSTAHAEGVGTMASAPSAHAEGMETSATNTNAHAEGVSTTASGREAHAEGRETVASGNTSHAEGWQTTASGKCSHSEGKETTASGSYSHAEGYGAEASGIASHAEAGGTASGDRSHAEGSGTVASGYGSHAEGDNTKADGSYSHAEGEYTIATHHAQHVFGEYNTQDNSTSSASFRGNFVEIVGNGTSESARSNARTLDWAGNESLAGGLTLGLGSAMETFLSPLQLRAMMRRLSSGRCHVVRGTGNSGVLVPAPILSASGITFGGQDSPGDYGYFFVDDYGAILGGVAANAGLIPYSQDLTLPPMIFPRSGYLPHDIMFYWDVENETIKYAYPPAYASSDLPENMYCFGYWRWNAATGRLYDCEYDIE